MVFPTAGSDQPRSPGYRAEQRPPGTAQGCDQSTPCLQTTAEPNLAQRKGLRWGAADLAPGSRLCQSSTSTSRRVVRAEPQPPAGGAGHTGPGRGAGGCQRRHSGMRDGRSVRGLIPAGKLQGWTRAAKTPVPRPRDKCAHALSNKSARQGGVCLIFTLHANYIPQQPHCKHFLVSHTLPWAEAGCFPRRSPGFLRNFGFGLL